MLSLLKHKLHSFGGYRISMDEGSGGTPGADPLVGQAAMKSADLADRVYADNKALVEELKPIIRDNAALQTSAAKDAYGQSKINLTDYNTLGRPAIKQQAIGHGLARYVDDATANDLYDLYATREGLVSGPGAMSPSSVVARAASSDSSGAATTMGAAATPSGMISHGGRLYTPEEFGRGMRYVPQSEGPFPDNGNTAFNRELATPEARAAARAAGYEFKDDGTYSITGAQQPTASGMARTGVTSQQSISTGGDQISFAGADGAGMAVSPDAALKSINAWRGTKNKAAAANAQAQIDALQKAGYQLTQDANGNYSFSSTPQTRLATATAENDKAIWNAERGLEKTAVATESARAADAAGTDVTQAISQNNQMLERQARGMVGFNPNKFARTMASNGVALGNASLRAGAVNSARENARRGVVAASDAGTANTINTTRGLPSQAMNWSASGQGQGNGAAASIATGITANNAAASPAFQGWNQAGQLANAQFGNQLASYNAQQQNSSSGLGGALGMAKMGMDIYSGGVSSKLFPALR